MLLWYGEHSCHLFPVESALYLLAHVLQGLGQPGHSVDGSFSRALLSKVDLHVVLLANPDGRNHLEQTGNHCWCGTSIGTSLSAVFHSGMDLNRAGQLVTVFSAVSASATCWLGPLVLLI